MEKTEVAEKIRRAGFRATKQRIALISFLIKAERPIRIQEIADALNGSIDPVTVYRMVDAFKKVGIVREVNLRGTHPRYELTDEHDHHHIVCTDCGRVEDFIDTAHEKIEAKVLARSRSFKKITGHSFDLYGLCKACVR
jgi:Fe2+ or Zn2+ uptake regulation protein